MSQTPEKKERIRIKRSELEQRDALIAELRQALQQLQAQAADTYRKTLQWLLLSIYTTTEPDEEGTHVLGITKESYEKDLPLLSVERAGLPKDSDWAAVFRVRKLTQEEVDESIKQAKKAARAPQKIITPSNG